MSLPDLGPLEMRVLGLLDGTEPQAVSAIRERLGAEGTELAYTTVMTVLRRLLDKGMVQRRKQSRRYLYTLAARPLKQGILDQVRRVLFRRERLQPIVALLDAGELSPDELRQLRKIVDQRIQGPKQ